jgi:hypothetical protein
VRDMLVLSAGIHWLPQMVLFVEWFLVVLTLGSIGYRKWFCLNRSCLAECWDPLATAKLALLSGALHCQSQLEIFLVSRQSIVNDSHKYSSIGPSVLSSLL